MPDHVDAEAYLFTDDTKVYKEIKTQTDTTSLQKDLDNLHEWSDKWLLKFHPNKCKVMTASNKRGNNREQKYHLYDSEGKEIELQNSDGEKITSEASVFQGRHFLISLIYLGTPYLLRMVFVWSLFSIRSLCCQCHAACMAIKQLRRIQDVV
jgi:hypothetical protein